MLGLRRGGEGVVLEVSLGGKKMEERWRRWRYERRLEGKVEVNKEWQVEGSEEGKKSKRDSERQPGGA